MDTCVTLQGVCVLSRGGNQVTDVDTCFTPTCLFQQGAAASQVTENGPEHPCCLPNCAPSVYLASLVGVLVFMSKIPVCTLTKPY